MDYITRYNIWKQKLPEGELSAELEGLENDPLKLCERFGSEMAFGTAGIRGKMGVGTAYMNIHTVARATQGLANYMKKNGGDEVAVSYDTRNNSRLFALVSAGVMVANGIRVFIYGDCQPTPMLSYAVRKLHCKMGIMITASHNPAQYNGYKVFDSTGCQINEHDAGLILSEIDSLDYFDGIEIKPVELNTPCEGVTVIEDSLTKEYYADVMKASLPANKEELSRLKVAYTPLHGTGLVHVTKLLEAMGVGRLHTVEQQREPDGNFTTCEYPNPETAAALELGIRLMTEKDCDILIATDPDADRVGVAVNNRGKAVILTGNEVGALLLDHVIEIRKQNGTLPKDPVAVRSLVSTPLADCIAEKNGVQCRRVLTGFKYIGEQLAMLEKEDGPHRFIFGFEESCGYLAGGYVRDKDAQNASVLVAQLAAHCKARGKTLVDRLEELYKEHGYHKSKTLSLEFDGLGGAGIMAEKMRSLRENPIVMLGERRTLVASDYSENMSLVIMTGEKREIGLPRADIVEIDLEGGATVIVRPSGTEPKIKIYVMVSEKTREQSDILLEQLSKQITDILG